MHPFSSDTIFYKMISSVFGRPGLNTIIDHIRVIL